MPKRPCPFEDDLPPQLKVHVGQKQVDYGVCRDERMKNVYGKTIGLLQEGVKTLSKKLHNSMTLNPVEVSLSKIPCFFKPKSERNTKQMVLNGKLELLGVDKAIKDTRPKYDLCDCSHVVDQNMFSKCSYCDQVLCNLCLQECIGCSEQFCQNCSLPLYDSEERNKCLNCYR